MISSEDATFFVYNMIMFIFVRHLAPKELSNRLKADPMTAAVIAGFFYALGSHIKQNYTRRIYAKPKPLPVPKEE